MWVVLPMLFQFVSDGFSFREKRQKRAALLGPFGYPVILGDLLDTLARKITGDDVFQDSYMPSGLSAIASVGRTFGDAIKLVDEKTSLEDVWKVTKEMGVTAGNLTGVPLKPFDNFVKGVTRLYQGESRDLRELIYSPYALDIKKEKKSSSVGTGGLDFGFGTTDIDVGGLDFGFQSIDFGI